MSSPSSPASGMSRLDWFSAIIVIVVWGLNFVVRKWGLATLSPLLLCALRFAAASLPFLLFVRPPKNLSWGILAAYGLVSDPELAATQAAVAAGTPMGPLE